MKSLRNLFRFGPGPSSSHTIAPYLAAQAFRKRLSKESTHVRITLQGSLALTGEGHHSIQTLVDAFKPYVAEVVRDLATLPVHPLTMVFESFIGEELDERCVYYSLGGGELRSEQDTSVNEEDVYPFHSWKALLDYMKIQNIAQIRDVCLSFEGKSIDEYLLDIVKKMFACIEKGLKKEGRIPANDNPRLNVSRSAKGIYEQAKKIRGPERRTLLISAYAYAVAECSACGENVVTAPTCGSSGVLPAVLYYLYRNCGVTLHKIRDSLYVAGMIGNLVKQNASIAGSIGGCQAEIGTAASMASAALCYVNNLSLYQIEYAAELAMEHFLGLSCDPVDGYVIIPCIERNGIAALRALASYSYARYISPVRQNKVNFDDVVAAMKITGDSLSGDYKETARGGLALVLNPKHC